MENSSSKSKLTCYYCNKTIRKDFIPINCIKCHKSFHKKCAKSINNRENHLTCITCQNLNSGNSKKRMYHSPHSLPHAEHLNTIFQDTINTDDNNSLNYPNLYNFQEKYIDISSVESLTSNGNEFLIVCVNMRSIVNLLNFSKLEAFIHNLEPKPDIIAVTETWIQSNAPGPYYNLSGYLFVSNSRKSHRGGGVGVYIKNIHNFTVVEELTIMNEKIFESIFIKIDIQNIDVLCGNIYRSPSNNIHSNEVFINTLHNCLDIIGLNKKCFIVGDLNYNLANHDNSHVSNFTELMLEKSYFSVINLHSHISDSNASVLDHIWTNLYSNQIKSGIILHSISDHLPTFACVNMNKSLPCPETKRLFTQQNIKKFNQSLNKIDITPILNEHNLDYAFELLMDTYSKAFNANFPLVSCTKNKTNHQPWFDTDLYELFKEKNKAFKKYLKKKTFYYKIKFNKIRNKYNRELLKKKENFYIKTFEKHKHNIKETWKIINNLLGNIKTPLCSSLLINGQSVQNLSKITNHFNEYFVGVAKDLVSNLPQNLSNIQTSLPPSTTQSIYLSPASPLEIKKLLANFKPKNSSGMDEIPITVLKTTPDNILYALTHVFNLSMLNGKFITCFKTAKVIPIFKKGNRTIVSNYRPISLLPTMSKVLEKIMYNRVISFLNKQDFFYKHQYGFRKKYSTCHATSILAESITDAFEKKEHVLGIFLDLSKAFDTIDHTILLDKLWHYGIRGLAHQWFNSYLSKRKQLVYCILIKFTQISKQLNMVFPKGLFSNPSCS